MSSPYDLNYSGVVQVVQTILEDDGSFGVGSLYKCLPCGLSKNSPYDTSNVTINTANTDRAIYCMSLNGVTLIPGRYYMAFQVSRNVFVIHNQAVFVD